MSITLSDTIKGRLPFSAHFRKSSSPLTSSPILTDYKLSMIVLDASS